MLTASLNAASSPASTSSKPRLPSTARRRRAATLHTARRHGNITPARIGLRGGPGGFVLETPPPRRKRYAFACWPPIIGISCRHRVVYTAVFPLVDLDTTSCTANSPTTLSRIYSDG